MNNVLKLFTPHSDFKVTQVVSANLMIKENGDYSIRLVHEYKKHQKYSQPLILKDINDALKVMKALDDFFKEKRGEKSTEEVNNILNGLESW